MDPITGHPQPGPGARRPRSFRFSLRVLVTTTIAVLMVAITVSATGTFLVRSRIDVIRTQSRTQLRPAQQATDQLTTAYVDQETAQRGYLLTSGGAFLHTYRSGKHEAQVLQSRLTRLLAHYPTALRRLDDAVQAGRQWQSKAAAPEIAARQRGTIEPDVLSELTQRGQTYFDSLRRSLDSLSTQISQLIALLLQRFDTAQHQADIATVTAVALAVLTALLCLISIRRVFTRPLNRLVVGVQAVADGAYQQRIGAGGPKELAMIADAVERMRDNIVTSSRALVKVQHDLSIRDERARLAADIHDLTLQNIFALGMEVQGLAATKPELAVYLDPLIADVARIDRELRAIVFAISSTATSAGLWSRVAELTAESARSLGFTPHLRVDEGIDSISTAVAADQLLAALRESLSNVARHAHATAANVTITVTSAPNPELRMRVSDNGVGIDPDQPPGNGVRNLAARAAAHGGAATVTAVPDGGTTVDWHIRLADDEIPVLRTAPQPSVRHLGRSSPPVPDGV